MTPKDFKIAGPLWGDQLARQLRQIGGGTLSKAYERITGKPCGCQKRQEMINALHQKWLDRRRPPHLAHRPNPDQHITITVRRDANPPDHPRDHPTLDVDGTPRRL